ncbi:MAG: hypothetical protein M0C28_38295 [Candidatus Moduliflexus flocculans]|nr:hypothetical protein [Candidatus Moduliflexus flocculans]
MHGTRGWNEAEFTSGGVDAREVARGTLRVEAAERRLLRRGDPRRPGRAGAVTTSPGPGLRASSPAWLNKRERRSAWSSGLRSSYPFSRRSPSRVPARLRGEERASRPRATTSSSAASPGLGTKGIPLGNGMIGALVWKKGDSLRLSLDRADLWDLRPVAEFSGPEFRFAWVRDHVLKNDYEPVHRMGDAPYDRDPAPTKIPAAALEFDISGLGEIQSVRLSLAEAVCRVRWKNGARLTVFVHATEPVGWFQFEGLAGREKTEARAARLRRAGLGPDGAPNSLTPGALARLGYPEPELAADETSVRYHQEGWGGMSYEVAADWDMPDYGMLTGAWSVSALYPETGTGSMPWNRGTDLAPDAAARALQRTLARDLESHAAWWKSYWAKSTVSLPDPVLEKQWYLEIYKFGAASRRGAPPITLQAVWTADDGGLPPWKGDFHNDLNTQLSYWPCYSGNRLEEGLAFLDWLWAIKPRCEALHENVFRRRRPQRPRRRDTRRRADGRLDPVLARADRLGLAGPPFLAPLALQRRPRLSRRAGLSLRQRRGRLPRQHRRAPGGRDAQAAAELEPRDQRQPDRRLVPGDDEFRPGPRPLALRRRRGHGRRARARRRRPRAGGGSSANGPAWPWRKTTAGSSSRRAILSKNPTGIFPTSWPSIRSGSST